MTEANKKKEGLITKDYLKSILEYNQETGKFTWLVIRANGRIHIGDIAGCLTNGYIRIRINNKNYQAHRLAWLYMTGSWPEFEIDHINQIRNDNRFENLRDTDKNDFNKTKYNNNNSGYTGVAKYKLTNKWMSRITIKNKIIYLGCFNTPEEASKAYEEAKKKYHNID